MLQWASVGASVVTYLVPLRESWLNPAVVLRGTASKARSTLQIDQPGQAVLFLGWFDGLIQARDTPSKKSQSAFVGLAVIDGDIKEQLDDAKLAWDWRLASISTLKSEVQLINTPGTLWSRLSISFAAIALEWVSRVEGGFKREGEWSRSVASKVSASVPDSTQANNLGTDAAPGDLK